MDDLPVEALVKKIKDGLGKIDKLMANLGLGDVLKSDFWVTLAEISLNSNGDIKLKGNLFINDRPLKNLGK